MASPPKRRLRLSLLLVVSHVTVALLALASAGALVGLLAPRLFDTAGAGKGAGPGRGKGPGLGELRPEIMSALGTALFWGLVVGLIAAIVLGVLAARGILKPVDALRRAARQLADGRYQTELPSPHTRELGELVDDVGTMAEQLVSTEERRIRLLGEVGHEMRTPLTIIDAQVEAILDGVLPASPENLAIIGAESRRLHRLAADLSALSRTEEGRVVLDMRRIDLGEVVRGVVERLRPQTADAGIELTCQAATEVWVEADADRLAQVLTNLVGNAIGATPSGGSIAVSSAVAGDDAVVRVADTGEGLAPADLTRIFERFYRVPGRRSAGQDGGSGIGLTIAQHLVEAHGGTLTAASPGIGLGATFEVRLPASPGVAP